MLIMNRKIEALNPTETFSPKNPIKYTDAPSLIPNSPKLIGGKKVFENITRFPAQK